MTDPAAPLTFDTPASGSASACAFCRQRLDRAYYTVNGQVACASCVAMVSRVHGAPIGIAGVATSLGLGSAAGFVGAVLWWAIRRFASVEIGLIAIGIGHFVGLGVRRGSGGRGGRGFQVLAVLLTYFWITANYVPDIVQAVISHGDRQAVGDATAGARDPAATSGTTAPGASEPPASAGGVLLAFAFLFGLAMASPFLQGAGNVLGLLIISFGLWQAWKLNAAVAVAVDGPFQLAAAAPPPVSGD